MLGVGAELVRTVGEVERDRRRRHHRGLLQQDVGALLGDRQALFEVLDRRHRLVVVLELDLELAEVRVFVVGVADGDRTPDELGDGQGISLLRHARSLAVSV